MYRADGPEEFRVVGETEFVQGIAAESASGRYGDLRAAAGIVGAADLRLGDRIAPVSRPRSRQARSASAASVMVGRGWSRACCRMDPWPRAAPPDQPCVPHLLLDPPSGAATRTCAPTGCRSRAGFYHTQIVELTDLAKAFPDTTIHLQSSWCDWWTDSGSDTQSSAAYCENLPTKMIEDDRRVRKRLRQVISSTICVW